MAIQNLSPACPKPRGRRGGKVGKKPSRDLRVGTRVLTSDVLVIIWNLRIYSSSDFVLVFTLLLN